MKDFSFCALAEETQILLAALVGQFEVAMLEMFDQFSHSVSHFDQRSKFLKNFENFFHPDQGSKSLARIVWIYQSQYYSIVEQYLDPSSKLDWTAQELKSSIELFNRDQIFISAKIAPKMYSVKNT